LPSLQHPVISKDKVQVCLNLADAFERNFEGERVEENEGKKNKITGGQWLVALFAVAAVLAVIAVVCGVEYHPSHPVQESQSEKDIAAQYARAVQPQQAPPATQPPPAPPVEAESSTSAPENRQPPSDNCHDSPGFQDLAARAGHPASREARRAYAEKLNSTMPEGAGMFVNAEGDDSEHLLVVGPPESEAVLREFATGIRSSDNAMAGACAPGFSDIQFIVREENFHQRLLIKFPTSAKGFNHYMWQQRGAAPM
jgi:hypothetical protein